MNKYINEYIREKRQEVESFLGEWMRADPDELSAPASYTLLAPCHRWRPILSLALAQAYGNDYENILPLSCAVEFVHAASLILDDMPSMDNAELRRGKKTSHLQFGEGGASLIAHYLVLQGRRILREHSPSDGKLFSKLFLRSLDMVDDMIKGQIIDLESASLSPGEIINMYSLKSGSPYVFSTAVGVGSSPAWSDDSITGFGNSVGVAYQIADDLGDVLAGVSELGKDIRKDKDKPTLVRALGIESAREEAVHYKEKALGFVKDHALLVGLLEKIIVVP